MHDRTDICLQEIYITYPRIALIKLDFPTPELPVTPICTSTFFQSSSLALNIFSVPDTPRSLMYFGMSSSFIKTYSDRSHHYYQMSRQFFRRRILLDRNQFYHMSRP